MRQYPPYESLPPAVFATIVYLDLFDYAPSLSDLKRYVLRYGNGVEKPTLFAIRRTLETNARITEHQGFYMLKGREHLALTRKKKWLHAKPFIRLLSSLPFVRAIWLSNSMGWNNAQRTSDIDLIIVTTAKHIWTARFFTTALMKLFRQRPGQQRPSKAICLSFYMTEEALNLKPLQQSGHDIHFAYWCAQVYPVTGYNLFKRYAQSNPWLHDYFQSLQWTIPTPLRSFEISPVERFTQAILELLTYPQFIEHALRRLQYRLFPNILREMANRDTRVMLNQNILKLHTNDRRKDVRDSFEDAIHNAQHNHTQNAAS
jgi:hypothetical protein